ncbi:hypothetical protein FB451DRAFT_1194775 [Mycena latifolia]|nr:hypothetical protein FB451DRAFT_1194775 [Mycena latifolia]
MAVSSIRGKRALHLIYSKMGGRWVERWKASRALLVLGGFSSARHALQCVPAPRNPFAQDAACSKGASDKSDQSRLQCASGRACAAVAVRACSARRGDEAPDTGSSRASMKRCVAHAGLYSVSIYAQDRQTTRCQHVGVENKVMEDGHWPEGGTGINPPPDTTCTGVDNRALKAARVEAA